MAGGALVHGWKWAPAVSEGERESRRCRWACGRWWHMVPPAPLLPMPRSGAGAARFIGLLVPTLIVSVLMTVAALAVPTGACGRWWHTLPRAPLPPMPGYEAGAAWYIAGPLVPTFIGSVLVAAVALAVLVAASVWRVLELPALGGWRRERDGSWACWQPLAAGDTAYMIAVESCQPGSSNSGYVPSRTALTEGLAEAGTLCFIHSVPCYTPAFSCGGFSLLQVVRWWFASISGLGRGAFCLLSSLGEARLGNTNACDGVGGATRPSSLRPVKFSLANPRVGWVAWRLVGLAKTMATSTKPGAATAGLATNPAPEGAGIECCFVSLAVPRLASVVLM